MRKKKEQQQTTGAKMSEEKSLEIVPSRELEVIESELDRTRLELETMKLQLAAKKKELEAIPSLAEKQVTVGNKSLALKEKIEAMKAYDNELVTGKFINRRAPGHQVKLPYIKYDDDPVKWYDFIDGGVYTIQRGFADQINEHYYTPHFIQKTGAEAVITGGENPGEGSMIAEVDTSNKKYAFVPQNF